jgi:hypothetical protein
MAAIHYRQLTCYATILLLAQTAFSQTIRGVMPATVTRAIPSQDDEQARNAALVESFTTRQYRAATVHKALAFTTAGLLLGADAMGAYHFLSMRNQGHDFRDAIGFTEESQNTIPQSGKTREIWRTQQSQTERIIHTALIAGSLISYTSTATIEFVMPRMSQNRSPFSNTNLHKYVVFTHMALMAANVGLGLAESHALSQGHHDIVQGVGIAHMVVGFAAPVVMVLGGLTFKIPGNY